VAEPTFVLPTIAQMTDRLIHLIPPHRSLFFDSGGPDSYIVLALWYSEYYGLSFILNFGDPVVMEKAKNVGGQDMLNEYWNRMYAAYAYASTGPAYVLLPGNPRLGTSWRAGTIWATVQWPILLQNTNVTHVTRVNSSISITEGQRIKPLTQSH
jgi:hypothetical protein